ncbi:hypothetical protein SteCoe_13793 [Stentor coeruleus]|uniref:CCHC-type domain-containing protein n=1 Tax=Stentor coeruleus TaxID=5963 RepID=A0A1R2C7G3_9CILI|nr:hypothetical protein SteCoe_13793 [Stentor coeruleus]
MPNKCRIYIGRLSRKTRVRDLEKEFSRYGRIRDLEIKHDYAFIEYSDPRDAEDAIYHMDNRNFDDSRIIVEYAGIRRERRKGPSTEDLCYNCHNPGHWANECKEEDCRGKCYRCGASGHIKRDCKASRSRSPTLTTKQDQSPYSSQSESHAQEYEA